MYPNYRTVAPDPATFLGRNPDYKAELFAELAPCPLYVNARVIAAPGITDNKRTRYRLGWVLAEQRWAKGQDLRFMPAALLDWAARLIVEVYPDIESATGLTDDEIGELQREQAEKRKQYAV